MKSLSDDLPKIHASFKAKYLHALREILALAEPLAFHSGAGLYLEPCEQGGVLIIATDGRALAVLRDPDGHANKPFKVHLPKAFIDRCAPPKPIEVFCEGDGGIDLPEWAQPGDVHLFDICAILFGQMNHPGVEHGDSAPALAHVTIETGNAWRETDYRVDEAAKPLTWRKSFDYAPAPGGLLYLQPEKLAVFQPILMMAITDRVIPSLAIAPRESGPFKTFIVSIQGFDDFIGLFAGMKPFEPAKLPAFCAEPTKTTQDAPEAAR